MEDHENLLATPPTSAAASDDHGIESLPGIPTSEDRKPMADTTGVENGLVDHETIVVDARQNFDQIKDHLTENGDSGIPFPENFPIDHLIDPNLNELPLEELDTTVLKTLAAEGPMDADMDTGEVSTGSIESLLEEEGEGEASDQTTEPDGADEDFTKDASAESSDGAPGETSSGDSQNARTPSPVNKTCAKCKKEKSLDKFVNRQYPNKFCVQCLECRLEKPNWRLATKGMPTGTRRKKITTRTKTLAATQDADEESDEDANTWRKNIPQDATLHLEKGKIIAKSKGEGGGLVKFTAPAPALQPIKTPKIEGLYFDLDHTEPGKRSSTRLTQMSSRRSSDLELSTPDSLSSQGAGPYNLHTASAQSKDSDDELPLSESELGDLKKCGSCKRPKPPADYVPYGLAGHKMGETRSCKDCRFKARESHYINGGRIRRQPMDASLSATATPKNSTSLSIAGRKRAPTSSKDPSVKYKYPKTENSGGVRVTRQAVQADVDVLFQALGPEIIARAPLARTPSPDNDEGIRLPLVATPAGGSSAVLTLIDRLALITISLQRISSGAPAGMRRLLNGLLNNELHIEVEKLEAVSAKYVDMYEGKEADSNTPASMAHVALLPPIPARLDTEDDLMED